MSTSKAAGLRDLLSSTEPSGPPSDSTPPESSRTRPSTAREASSPSQPAETSPVSAWSTASRAQVRGSAKKRSNITLSEDLVERIALARDKHRWTLVHLFETALAHWSPIDDIEAGRRLADTGPRHRQQGVRLSEGNFDQLDLLGEQWRMNRSETSTVVLEQRLDELGL